MDSLERLGERQRDQEGDVVESFVGKIAVITGAGSGIGRELARMLSENGCHLALCDIADSPLAKTKSLCDAGAPAGTRVTTHRCDVSEETQVLAFRDAVMVEHSTDVVHLVFNNAGIGGSGSFIADSRCLGEGVRSVLVRGVLRDTGVPPIAHGR